MAYASLVSLAQTTQNLLQDHDQYPISRREKEQITSIHRCVIFLLAFLEEFPEKASTLEGRIRDLANEAEDIIEDFMWKNMFPKHQSRMFLWLKRIKGDMYVKLKRIGKEIDSIEGEVMEIKNGTETAEDVRRSAATPSSRQPGSSREDAMVGFDDDFMAIKERLCGQSSSLEVIPIFGMGGIGKTTLARNAFDDPLSMEYFDIRAWVTVSQDYSVREILSSLLVSMRAEILGQNDESGMQENVYKRLKGRRYLIVMDDMWSTKAWDDVKMIFPNDHNGSRVMLTTRLSDVAAYPDSSNLVHEMHFMNADQSWNLLKQRVFMQENYPHELETIGVEIARSCRGLPLAIVLVAGLLTTVDRTPASWMDVLRNVNQVVSSANDEQFGNRVLSLSYNHLPHHLRPCFLYMGGFPEDYEIRVSRLVKLWVAEGFLKPCVSKSFEEVAEEYLEDLVKRSLVLVIKRKANGKIKCCSVHDLLQDLCIRKAQEEKFYLKGWYVHGDVRTSKKNQRRVIVANSYLDSLGNIHGSTIRTVMCFSYADISLRFIENIRLLRVLDVLTRTSFVSLPVEVFELLIHLRYLAFGCSTSISPTISNLKNLQTLIIKLPREIGENLQFVVCLPSEIWWMPQLRHLVLLFRVLLPDPAGAASALENLQTISNAMNFICDERILKMIPNVKKLGISYVRGMDVDDYHLENLVYLHQLEKLKLERCAFFCGKLNPVFPKALKKLTLIGLPLPWKDMSIVGSLPNLEVLKLKDNACVGREWKTTEGEFQSLKFLLIESSDLLLWITDSSHFPCLKCLLLHHCDYLGEIPDGIGEIPTLELIEVSGRFRADRSLMESAKRIQEEQQSYGNDALQVRWVKLLSD